MIFPHFLLGWQISRLLFNQLTFEEFMENFMFSVTTANHVMKALVVMRNQNQIEDLKKMADSFMDQLQTKEEEDIYKRTCRFIRF